MNRERAAALGAAALLIVAVWLRRSWSVEARALASAILIVWTFALAWSAGRLGRSGWVVLLGVPLGVVAAQPARAPHETALALLSALPSRLLVDGDASVPAVCLLALAASWVLLASTARAGAPSRRDLIVAVGFVVAGAAYFGLGALRALPIAAGLGVLLVRGPIEGRRRWLLAPAALATAAYAVSLVAGPRW